MITLTIDGEEYPLRDEANPITLSCEGPISYRAGDILVNEQGRPLGVLMHSTDYRPRGQSVLGDLYAQVSVHWVRRDTPAHLDNIRWTSLDLGSVEYAR
jgi:hypothetical protein